MSRLKDKHKGEVDKKFIEIIYGFWKNKYAVIDKSSTDVLLNLKDLYQVLCFTINKYQFLYYKKLDKYNIYDLKKQAENCFGQIADHDNELLHVMCNCWRNEVVNLIGESLNKIFPEFAEHGTEKTTLVSDEIMKKNIEQTLEIIIQTHKASYHFYEDYKESDISPNEAKELLDKIYSQYKKEN